jgi:hypothetical protein
MRNSATALRDMAPKWYAMDRFGESLPFFRHAPEIAMRSSST